MIRDKKIVFNTRGLTSLPGEEGAILLVTISQNGISPDLLNFQSTLEFI